MKKKFAFFGLVAVSALMIGCSSTQCRDGGDCASACGDKAACCGSEACGDKPCGGEGKACCGSCGGEKKACCGTCGGGEHSYGDHSHSHDG